MSDANIRATAFRFVTEMPSFFKRNVFRLVTFVEQSINTFKDDKIFFVRRIYDVVPVTIFDLRRIKKFLRVEVGFHRNIFGKLFLINAF